MKIVEATEKHLPALVDIAARGWLEVMVTVLSYEEVKKWIDSNAVNSVLESGLDCIRVCEINGDVAGFVMINGDRIREIYVEHSFHRQGVASSLVNFAEAEMKRLGFKSANVNVKRINFKSNSLFKKLNYVVQDNSDDALNCYSKLL
ncbi:hypothetical protein CS022_04520 [Veronia nyctiphanis]|uniref:N-acetyltransferase domain-containing protein n=1 Tax=Veronia nyctiphanis TaxID=1278244 RepID=A0A4Q0YSU4_9GAMM|nr:GNAT family N-acetyltransferase [Veronia nyctiphanis]RXJ74320.1 hypothetical protein CS022_04520 [Veronia nyctiphanis]